jgi:hypothetical protein
MSDEAIQGPADEYAEMRALVESNGGRVTAEIILERATDPSSTFHSHFVWDDTEAAHRYRLQQAGGLIRKFKVIRNVGGRTIRVDAFVKVPDAADGYVPVQEAMTMDWVVQHRRIQLIASMERLAEQLRNWEEFSVVAEAITEALAANAA